MITSKLTKKLIMTIGALGFVLAGSAAAQAGDYRGSRHHGHGYSSAGSLIGVYILGGQPERRHVTHRYHRNKHVVYKRHHGRPYWAPPRRGWRHGHRHWHKSRHWHKFDRHHGGRGHGGWGHGGRDHGRHGNRHHR